MIEQVAFHCNHIATSDLDDEARLLERSPDVVARIRKDQARAVARSFRDVIIEFNSEQVSYKDRCQSRINNYLKIGTFSLLLIDIMLVILADLEMNEEELQAALDNNDLFNTTGVRNNEL